MAEGDAPQVVDLRKDIIAILPRLRRFCYALTGSMDDGDDLCQATIERALTKSALFQPGSRLDSWMYRIAQNIHIDAKRRLATRGYELPIDEMASAVGADGLRLVEGRSDLARVRQAMQALPDEQRLVLTHVVLDGLSYKDTAAALGIPVGTVMSRLARARQTIDRHVHGDIQ